MATQEATQLDAVEECRSIGRLEGEQAHWRFGAVGALVLYNIVQILWQGWVIEEVLTI